MLPSAELSSDFRSKVVRLAREEGEQTHQWSDIRSTHYATEMTLGTAAGRMLVTTAKAANNPKDMEEITTALRNTAQDDPETFFSTVSDRVRGSIKRSTSMTAGDFIAFKRLGGQPPAKPLSIVPLDCKLRPVHELVTKDRFPELTEEEITRAKNRIRNNAMKGCVGLKETADQATSGAVNIEL